MQSRDRDAAMFWDMAEAIREIQHFMVGVSETEYLETLWLRRVVERNFEILGEAARRISTEFQQAHPEVDWRNMIGLRNIIAHRYEQVDHEILWDIIAVFNLMKYRGCRGQCPLRGGSTPTPRTALR